MDEQSLWNSHVHNEWKLTSEMCKQTHINWVFYTVYVIPKTDLHFTLPIDFSFVGGTKPGMRGTIECSGELSADNPGVAPHECDLGQNINGQVYHGYV